MVKLDIFRILNSYLKANDIGSYHHPFPTVKHMTVDRFNIPVLTGRTLKDSLKVIWKVEEFVLWFLEVRKGVCKSYGQWASYRCNFTRIFGNMEKHKPVSFQAITCKKLQITYPTYSCICYGEIVLKLALLHYLKTIKSPPFGWLFYRSSCLSDVGSWWQNCINYSGSNCRGTYTPLEWIRCVTDQTQFD